MLEASCDPCGGFIEPRRASGELRVAEASQVTMGNLLRWLLNDSTIIKHHHQVRASHEFRDSFSSARCQSERLGAAAPDGRGLLRRVLSRCA